MKTYLVGGAVRDRMLGREVTDRDWVVVGATPQAMLDQGFVAVGKDFPVFLHPRTREEYALARTERKTGQGYHGFAFDVSTAVTLDEDLQRRDLTINAMAEDESGRLIDPYQGQKDIEARLLRHVSPAFAEDPVRVLRVARFYARYACLGFRVAPETLELMRTMVRAGEVDALVAERVWQELQKALTETSPQLFFSLLRECGALLHLFPELDQLFGVPQSPQHHPEVDTGIHTLMVLEQSCRLSDEPVVRFAALTHDLGKGMTDPGEWPKHHAHEQLGIPILDAFCERLRAPGQYRKLASRVMRYHGQCHQVRELPAATVVELLEAIDAYRQPTQLEAFLLACEADARGRMGYEQIDYPQRKFLQQAWLLSSDVRAEPLLQQGYQGKALGEQIRLRRIEQVRMLAAGEQAAQAGS